MERVDLDGILRAEPIRDPPPSARYIGEAEEGVRGIKYYNGVEMDGIEYHVGDFCYVTPNKIDAFADVAPPGTAIQWPLFGGGAVLLRASPLPSSRLTWH